MAIAITCTCGKKLNAKDESAGKKVKCPGCGKSIKVPDPAIHARLQAMVQQIEAIPEPEDELERPTLALVRAQAHLIVQLLAVPGGIVEKMPLIQANEARVRHFESELGPGHEGVVILKRLECLTNRVLVDGEIPSDQELAEEFPMGGNVYKAALCPQCRKRLPSVVGRNLFSCESCGAILKSRMVKFLGGDALFLLFCFGPIIWIATRRDAGEFWERNWGGIMCGGVFWGAIIAGINWWMIVAVRYAFQVRRDFALRRSEPTAEGVQE